MPYKNISGMKFGFLTAIHPAGIDKNKKTLWKCLCDCGKEKLSPIGSLMSGNTKSCGCGRNAGFQKFIDEKRKNAFGIYHPRAQNSWSHMIDRCTNPSNKNFNYYGGRGIMVCDQWLDLRQFVADMGDPPVGMTLDRRNTNGNYEADNCRWATPKQQARNTRTNVFVEYDGRKITIAELAELTGIPGSTIYYRVSHGLHPTQVCTRYDGREELDSVVEQITGFL